MAPPLVPALLNSAAAPASTKQKTTPPPPTTRQHRLPCFSSRRLARKPRSYLPSYPVPDFVRRTPSARISPFTTTARAMSVLSFTEHLRVNTLRNTPRRRAYRSQRTISSAAGQLSPALHTGAKSPCDLITHLPRPRVATPIPKSTPAARNNSLNGPAAKKTLLFLCRKPNTSVDVRGHGTSRH